MTPATGLTIQLTLLMILLGIVLYFKAVELSRRLTATQRPLGASQATEAPIDTQGDPTPLAGAGAALAHPPADLGVTLAYLRAHYAHRRYTIPLGWQGVDGRSLCVVAHLIDDAYHILLTAKSRVGKDNAALAWLLTLALQHPAQQLQVAIIDGKGGLDWIGWKGKAHTWRLAITREEIAPAMEALTTERERRAVILREAGVSSWEGYQGHDLPLLVIYVSELLLLQDATSPKELERWLNSELSSSGAFGMRYLVATQTASNFSTRWRGQVDLFVAGFQPSASQDQPNTGLSTAEIHGMGAVPPSELPGLPHSRGVFTLVQGRQAEMVRIGYLDDAQRRRWLAQLPSAPTTTTGAASTFAPSAVSSISVHTVRPAPALVAVTGAAMHGPIAMMAPHGVATLLGDTVVSPRIDADNNLDQMDNGNADGRAQDTVDSTAGNATGLTDDEIKSLLLSKTPVRQIAMRLRGRMQKRLERIAGVRAGFSVRSR